MTQHWQGWEEEQPQNNRGRAKRREGSLFCEQEASKAPGGM